MKRARVYLADRNPEFLIGATASLSQLPQVDIVGFTTSGAEALQQVEALSPDVFVFDADMLGLAEWEALWRLRERADAPRVVITAHDLSERSRASACAVGADVCITKDELGRKLFKTVAAMPLLANLGAPSDSRIAREIEQVQILAHGGRIS